MLINTHIRSYLPEDCALYCLCWLLKGSRLRMPFIVIRTWWTKILIQFQLYHKVILGSADTCPLTIFHSLYPWTLQKFWRKKIKCRPWISKFFINLRRRVECSINFSTCVLDILTWLNFKDYSYIRVEGYMLFPLLDV